MTTQAYVEQEGTTIFSDAYGRLNLTTRALRTGHEGPTEPPNPTAYMVWNDTTANLVKQRNSANDGWNVIGKLGVANWGNLPLTGGSMSGALNMGGQAITNLAAGSGAGAARQIEVDAKAPLVAPQFTGDARVNQDPEGSDSLTRRAYTEGRYLAKAGGTMTGLLTLSAIGTADLHPVGLQQLRDFVGFNPTAGHGHTGGDARKVKGSHLDSESAPAGYVPTATGSGSLTTWNQIGSGSIAPNTVSQGHMNTGTDVEIAVAAVDPGTEVDVAISGLSGYTFLPDVKHSNASGRTIFEGLSKVGATYGIGHIRLRCEVVVGTLSARFKQVAA